MEGVKVMIEEVIGRAVTEGAVTAAAVVDALEVIKQGGGGRPTSGAGLAVGGARGIQRGGGALGSCGWAPLGQAAFGVPTDDRSRDHGKEAIEIVVGMWENETFSWESENISFPERMQTPKPFQDPHPPVWQAAAT